MPTRTIKKPTTQKTARRAQPTSKKPQPEPKRDSTTSQAKYAEVLRRGPNGAPVYGKLGYELSYKKIAASRRGGPRRSRGANDLKMLEREAKEGHRKAEIMGMDKKGVSAMTSMRWNDGVARDLGIPYHKVEYSNFEKWWEKGFRAAQGEFTRESLTEGEEKRILDLATGSAFRK